MTNLVPPRKIVGRNYAQFGLRWKDARVFGKVVGSTGGKCIVQWEIDGTKTAFESANLQFEGECEQIEPIIQSDDPVPGEECDLEDDVSISNEEVEYQVTAEELNRASVSS